MENTGKIFFEEGGGEQPQWFVATGDQWIGPLSAAQVYGKILANEISWAHFVWRQGQHEWTRICETPAFQAAVPGLPKRLPSPEVPSPEVRSGTRRERSQSARPWFIYRKETQYGPFSEEELHRLIEVGQLDGRAHAWRDGMENWQRIDSLSEFRLQHGAGAKPAASEQRSAPRRPLVAKILLADDQALVVGVCRDVSVGGMQVLTDVIPGPVGSKIKLNVSQGKGIEPFVASGTIVRVLEDERGFSFRFNQLSEQARKTIESYVQ